MQLFNIYLSGVGGQGIGLLCEILLRAADYAGYTAKAVDTHGLAQRGGIVVSHIRLGEDVPTPLIPERQADLVIGLERHEALRSVQTMLRDGGTLVYYDTVLQPLGVRLGTETETSTSDLARVCGLRGITVHRVEPTDLADPRMQNIVLLVRIDRLQLVPGIATEHIVQAMDDLLTDSMLAANKALFQTAR